MSSIALAQLGEIADLQAGVGFPMDLQGRSSGDYPVAKVGDISRVGRSGEAVISEADHYIDEGDLARLRARPIPPGSVLFAKIGEAIRHNHRVIAGCAILVDNNAMAAIPTRRVESRYLYYFLRSVDFYGLASATTVPALRKSELKRLPVPLLPLTEQRRIAEILDKADALRAKRRATLAQLDTLTQSIFVDMFGDPATNPKDWPVVTIADICEVKGGKRLPKGEDYSSILTPHRYIRVVDMKAGRVDEAELVYLRPEIQAQIAQYVVNLGDVIISIAGSIGLVAPVPPTLDGVNLTENAAKLVPRRRAEFDAVFLAAYLQTPHAQRQIRSHVGQVTIGKLALFRIEKIKVPLPELALQREFVLRISALRDHDTVLRRAQLELDTLFTSLQQRAFRGEL